MTATKRFDSLAREIQDACDLLKENKVCEMLTSDWERNALSDAAFLCERIAEKFKKVKL